MYIATRHAHLEAREVGFLVLLLETTGKKIFWLEYCRGGPRIPLLIRKTLNSFDDL